MSHAALVILAAGIGSRYGGGVKQLEPVGPNGELIIDYSIHDALKAGFNKVVFILRREIFDDFYEVIGERMEKRFRTLGVEWAYVWQDMDDLPEGFACPEGRKKPWGTGQALLACREVLHEPFAVINADDYYGKAAYRKAYDFLQRSPAPNAYGMVAYVLRNTLSDNGSVTRGICHIESGALTGVTETHDIIPTADGASGEFGPLDPESMVSMNFWMFPTDYLKQLAAGFPDFLRGMTNPMKDEYLLPIIVDGELQQGKCTVTVERSEDSWFGVTYHEDKPAVVEAFRKLYHQGAYDAADLLLDADVLGVDLPVLGDRLAGLHDGAGQGPLLVPDGFAGEGGPGDLAEDLVVVGVDSDPVEDLDGFLGSHLVSVGDDGGVDVGVDELLGLLEQLPGEDDGGRGPVPALGVLGLGDLDDHLGGGVLHVDLLQDGDAVVGDDDVPDGVDEHLVHSLGAEGRPDCVCNRFGSSICPTLRPYHTLLDPSPRITD